MNRGTFIRRHLLKLMAAAGTIGLPAVRPFSPRARGAPAYNPAARFDLAVSEVECRRNSAGRMLMAGIIKANPFLERFTVADLGTGRTAKCAFLVHSC